MDELDEKCWSKKGLREYDDAQCCYAAAAFVTLAFLTQ